MQQLQFPMQRLVPCYWVNGVSSLEDKLAKEEEEVFVDI
jgi:hypothetical protein